MHDNETIKKYISTGNGTVNWLSTIIRHTPFYSIMHTHIYIFVTPFLPSACESYIRTQRDVVDHPPRPSVRSKCSETASVVFLRRPVEEIRHSAVERDILTDEYETRTIAHIYYIAQYILWLLEHNNMMYWNSETFRDVRTRAWEIQSVLLTDTADAGSSIRVQLFDARRRLKSAIVC